MAGKQVYEVPANNVGGSSSCIAVCIRGTDIQKVNGLRSFAFSLFFFITRDTQLK